MRDKSRPGLYQRGEHWHVAIYPQKGSGASAYRKALGTKDHVLAAEWYDANAGEIRQSFWRAKNGLKPERYWEEAVAVYVEESTRLDWGPDAARLAWVNSKLNGMELKEISREFWKRITDKRREETLKVRGKCAGGTLNRYTALATSVLTTAARKLHWIDLVPLLYVYPESEPRDRVFTVQEVQSRLNTLPAWAGAIFRFALATGLRRENIIGLRWEWIDMQNRVIRIPREAFKQRRAHVQALNDTAASLIREQPGFLQPVGDRQPFVFLRASQPVSGPILRHAWDHARAIDGIEGRFHDGRRTWATWLREAGVSLDDAMLLGGWSSKDMLREVYSKPSVGFLLGKARSLDDVLHTFATHGAARTG